MSMLGQISHQQAFVQNGWYQRQAGILLPAEVSAILAKYNGTLLLPGASGALRSGFQPGNYVESTGQTLTPVDGAVGLVLDAAQQVGSEAWTYGSPFVCGSVAAYATVAGQYGVAPVDVGKSYLIDMAVSNLAANGLSVQIGSVTPMVFTAGAYSRKSAIVTAITAKTLVIKEGATAGGSAGATVTISVRELPGTHAVQATTQNKPLLRNASDVQSWQFDGIDDRLTLPVPPLVSTDDFYQAFALRCSTSGANKVFADLLTNPVTGTRLGCLRISSTNFLQVLHVNDAGGTVAPSGLAISEGQLLLVEALRAGSSHTVFADGVTNIQSTLSGNYTTTHATLGARGQGTSELFLGHMHGVFECKGTPTDAERATIRKFMASLQGRTL